jgi:hypothetical protein
MTTITHTRDQVYADIFTTAMEGGVGYWSQLTAYHYSDANGNDDLLGFGAMLVDTEDEDHPEFIVTRETIVKGITALAAETADPRCEFAEWIKTANIIVRRADAYDVIDYDAGFADAVVQLALFGEVVYG